METLGPKDITRMGRKSPGKRALDAIGWGIIASLIGATIAALVLMTIEAAAQEPVPPTTCFDSPEKMVLGMKARHNEMLLGIGDMARGGALAVFVAPDGGWTVLVQMGPETMCVVEHGGGWMQIPQGDPA